MQFQHSSPHPRTPRFRAVATAALLIALAPILLHAAVVSGTVRSTAGTSVVAASIGFADLSIGTVTDENGRYLIPNVPAGSHQLVVVALGYRTLVRTLQVADSSRNIIIELELTPDELNGATVVVTARARQESDASARLTERTAPSVVTVMSAQSIARYPDVSTAEIAKRISGLSITRVRGEARDLIVRGMDAHYNSTLIDGVKIPSASTRGGVVDLDYLPSELLQRIEVTKELTPDMEGDAIGGAVNLVMRNAPERFLLQGRVATGYNSALVNTPFVGFRTDSILADPLERNGKGYLVAPGDFTRDNVKFAEYQAPPDLLAEATVGSRLYDGQLGYLISGSVLQSYRHSETTRNYDAVDPDNNPYLIRKQYRFHGHNDTKWGLNSRLDYIFDAHNDVELSFVGLIRQNRETRLLNDTNYVYSPVLYEGHRTVFQTYDLGDLTLTGHHAFSGFDLKWKGGWSEARQLKPDRAELLTSSAVVGDSVVGSPVFYALTRDWNHNEDRDLFAGADLRWNGLQKGGLVLKGGFFQRMKERANYMNQYRLQPVVDSTGHLPLYTSIDSLQWDVLNIGGTPEYSSNNYTASQNVSASYLMASWSSGVWNLVGGIRAERTTGTYSTHDVNSLQELTASQSYTDLLPSVHLRYALDDQSNLRFSIGQTISRPDYFDLVPYNFVGEEYREMGNPNLKRTRATNLDLRYETFPSTLQQVGVGLFYKSIQDPIESTLDISNPAIPTVMPKNLGHATNMGIELLGAMSFLQHFSVQANYTYTHSAITTIKVVNDRATGTTQQVSQTRPLQGQSEHIGNLDISYRNEPWGTFAQVSFSFTGRRIWQVSPYLGLDHWESDFPMLDLSIEQGVTNGLKLFLHLNNLTNTNYEIRLEEGTVIQQERFGRTAMLGVTWRP